MPDQIMLLSDQTFDRRKLIIPNKYITVLMVECTHFKHFLSIETTWFGIFPKRLFININIETLYRNIAPNHSLLRHHLQTKKKTLNEI